MQSFFHSGLLFARLKTNKASGDISTAGILSTQCRKYQRPGKMATSTQPHHRLFPENIELNVGGKFYSTSVLTLTREPDSLLGRIFSGRQTVDKDGTGKYFIDRDGALFRYILDFLRTKRLHLPEDFCEIARLRNEAEFFEIQGLELQLDLYSRTRERAATIVNERFGFITLHIRSTYAFGRVGQADVNFRKLQRIVVCGRVSLCREVFGETLNENRDPNPEGNRYTNRFYLKHNYVEKAFMRLQDCDFQLVSSSGGESGNCTTDSIKSDEDKWDHFTIHVFLRR